MKKITEEEYQNLEFDGKGPATMPYVNIFNLRTGEILIIEKADWHRKDTPGKMCRYIEKRHPQVKYLVLRLKNKKGWTVKRIS